MTRARGKVLESYSHCYGSRAETATAKDMLRMLWNNAEAWGRLGRGLGGFERVREQRLNWGRMGCEVKGSGARRRRI